MNIARNGKNWKGASPNWKDNCSNTPKKLPGASPVLEWPGAQKCPLQNAAASYSFARMKTVEAIIETNGEVHLVEPVHVLTPRRALVTILEEAPTVHDAALLSEAALAEDWNRAEEDAAWAHLQPAK